MTAVGGIILRAEAVNLRLAVGIFAMPPQNKKPRQRLRCRRGENSREDNNPHLSNLSYVHIQATIPRECQAYQTDYFS